MLQLVTEADDFILVTSMKLVSVGVFYWLLLSRKKYFRLAQRYNKSLEARENFKCHEPITMSTQALSNPFTRSGIHGGWRAIIRKIPSTVHSMDEKQVHVNLRLQYSSVPSYY